MPRKPTRREDLDRTVPARRQDDGETPANVRRECALVFDSSALERTRKVGTTAPPGGLGPMADLAASEDQDIVAGEVESGAGPEVRGVG